VLKANWRKLNEQWFERSQKMFQRAVKEPDITLARQIFHAACLSEKNRLEWQSECLPLSDQSGEGAVWYKFCIEPDLKHFQPERVCS